jgi:hypothetical protein
MGKYEGEYLFGDLASGDLHRYIHVSNQVIVYKMFCSPLRPDIINPFTAIRTAYAVPIIFGVFAIWTAFAVSIYRPACSGGFYADVGRSLKY